MTDIFAKKQGLTDLELAQRNIDALKYENKDLQRSLQLREAEVNKLERALGIHEKLARAPKAPAWIAASPKKTSKKYRGTWYAMLSDLHLDEVIQMSEILGINHFNRTIAEFRLRETFHGIIRIAKDFHSGIEIDGLVLAMGGDIFSGVIHDELRRTNEAPILDSIDHWIDPMVQGILMLADAFGRVHIPVVVGNHGRYDRKPIAKLRARENYDWFFAKAIARALRDDKRITFEISDGPDVLIPTYGYTTLMTHGDQARGGSGWGGAMSPIMRLDDKKSRRQAQVNLPYDYIIIGHWHQLTFFPKGVVNGSLKGYDEYAFQENFGYEVPQQAMWLMTPEHARTFTAPVFSQDPIIEGWKEAA
jgi:hypothetical protein